MWHLCLVKLPPSTSNIDFSVWGFYLYSVIAGPPGFLTSVQSLINVKLMTFSTQEYRSLRYEPSSFLNKDYTGSYVKILSKVKLISDSENVPEIQF